MIDKLQARLDKLSDAKNITKEELAIIVYEILRHIIKNGFMVDDKLHDEPSALERNKIRRIFEGLVE